MSSRLGRIVIDGIEIGWATADVRMMWNAANRAWVRFFGAFLPVMTKFQAFVTCPVFEYNCPLVHGIYIFKRKTFTCYVIVGFISL